MRRVLVLAAFALLAGVGTAQVDPFAFMPDGGRGLMARAFPTPEAQAEALAATRSAEEWLGALTASDLSERERATLAAYLSRVAPSDYVQSLPPDGRDLALVQCQSCHSLFSGYLMQRRDRNGWLVIFASPFHKDIPMSQTEREIFADYSAINLPMREAEIALGRLAGLQRHREHALQRGQVGVEIGLQVQKRPARLPVGVKRRVHREDVRRGPARDEDAQLFPVAVPVGDLDLHRDVGVFGVEGVGDAGPDLALLRAAPKLEGDLGFGRRPAAWCAKGLSRAVCASGSRRSELPDFNSP